MQRTGALPLFFVKAILIIGGIVVAICAAAVLTACETSNPFSNRISPCTTCWSAWHGKRLDLYDGNKWIGAVDYGANPNPYRHRKDQQL